MSTFGILFGFALMVFLPCVIAVLGSRAAAQEESAYSDRLVQDAVGTRFKNGTVKVSELAAPEIPTQAGAPVARPEALARTLPEWGDSTDPQAPGRAAKGLYPRAGHAQIEILKAHAVEMRAHAESLAAIARAALAKAEFAAAEATAVENQAAQAILETRRAA